MILIPPLLFSCVACFCHNDGSDTEFSSYNVSIPFHNFCFLLKTQTFLFMERLLLTLKSHARAFVPHLGQLVLVSVHFLLPWEGLTFPSSSCVEYLDALMLQDSAFIRLPRVSEQIHPSPILSFLPGVPMSPKLLQSVLSSFGCSPCVCHLELRLRPR